MRRFTNRLWTLTAAGLAGGVAMAADQPASSQVAAVVGGESITLNDLDAKALKTNMKLAQSLYDARKSALDQILLEKLLEADAKAKGVAVDKVIRERIAEKVKPVSDDDVKAYFEANKARMGNKTLEQTSPQIKSQLTTQRETESRNNLLNELKSKAGVKVTLAVPRIEVAVAANDPMKGPAGAKITIVEFSDFQ